MKSFWFCTYSLKFLKGRSSHRPAVFYTHVGVVLCLLRDVRQKWMTSDFSQPFISMALSRWRVNSADQMLLVSGSCFLSPALWLLKANEEKESFPKKVLFFALLFGLISSNFLKNSDFSWKERNRGPTRLLYSRIYACTEGIWADVHLGDAGGMLLCRIGEDKRFSSSHRTFIGKHLPCRPADEQLVLPCDECQVSWLVR